MITLLKGRKTYIMTALLVIYAAAGVATGHMTVDAAIGLVLGSGTAASLRAAVAKIQ